MARRLQQGQLTLMDLDIYSIRNILAYLTPTDIGSWSVSNKWARDIAIECNFNLTRWFKVLTAEITTKEGIELLRQYSRVTERMKAIDAQFFSDFYSGTTISEINIFMANARKVILQKEQQYQNTHVGIAVLKTLYSTTKFHHKIHNLINKQSRWFTKKDLEQDVTNRGILETAIKKGIWHKGLWTYEYPMVHSQPDLIDFECTTFTKDARMYLCTINKQKNALYTLIDIIKAFDISQHSDTEKRDIIDLHRSITKIAPITILNNRVLTVIDTICNERIIRQLMCHCGTCSIEHTQVNPLIEKCVYATIERQLYELHENILEIAHINELTSSSDVPAHYGLWNHYKNAHRQPGASWRKIQKRTLRY